MKRTILIGLTWLIAACSPSTQDAIVGRWQEVGGEEVIHFLPSGVVQITEGLLSSSGTYEVIGDRQVRMTLALFGLNTGTHVVSILLEGDTLTVTTPENKTSRYSRLAN